MFKSIKLAVAAAGLFVASFTSANAAYITDGDFSTPNGGGSFVTYNSGNSFGPWNVTSGSVDLIGGYWQSPTVGGGSVDLNGGGPGTLSQAVSTTAGQFKLNFSLSANPDNGTGLRSVQVSVGDVIQNFTFNILPSQTHSAMNYITETLYFNATGATTLSFASLVGSGPYGAVIGGVSISAVPLPASAPLFVAALLAAAGLYHYNKKRLAA